MEGLIGIYSLLAVVEKVICCLVFLEQGPASPWVLHYWDEGRRSAH